MEVFAAEWSAEDIKGAINLGFHYLESMDSIVGFVFTPPQLMKTIVLECPEDVVFDFIPEGIGLFRTAYLKYKFGRDNKILFVDQDKTKEVVITLK
jgi:hypothetical protein